VSKGHPCSLEVQPAFEWHIGLASSPIGAYPYPIDLIPPRFLARLHSELFNAIGCYKEYTPMIEKRENQAHLFHWKIIYYSTNNEDISYYQDTSVIQKGEKKNLGLEQGWARQVIAAVTYRAADTAHIHARELER
jgi:hypothetical protein